MSHPTKAQASRAPWNNRSRIGAEPPLQLREIWAIRIRLQLTRRTRDSALFNLAIDSKLRGCDLVRLRIGDISHRGCVVARATVVQRKTPRPVRFELTEQTRDASEAWIAQARLESGEYPRTALLADTSGDIVPLREFDLAGRIILNEWPQRAFV